VSRHRALVVVTPTAAAARESGATLRVEDVCAALRDGGHDPRVVTARELDRQSGGWCTGVVVSYAGAGTLRRLRLLTARTWLDAVDSWLLVDGSGLRAGHLSYAARGVRDGVRLLAAPTPDLATWISGADLISDRGTVRGRRRLVLPGGLTATAVGPPSPAGPRLVLAGAWTYSPNADGLRWMIREVVPLLDREVDVYGHGACPAAGLRVHGHVDAASSLYRQGDVHLAPVRFGGGVKRKVLQPLLAGLHVVTTPAGAHGLQAHPLLLVADAPAAFAAAATTALRKPAGMPPRPASVLDRNDRDAVVDWIDACPHG
jgi:hypothetical protein